MSRILGVALAWSVAVVSPAFADAPRGSFVVLPPIPGTEAVTSNVIFLNRCPNNCSVSGTGTDNGTTDPGQSSFANGQLTAFAAGDTNWNAVVACVKDTFADFNIMITDQRPSGSYLTAMVAGTGAQVGQGGGILGVAPFRCQQYQQNALVFAFANDGYFGSSSNYNVNEVCATIAQEIAHTWSLDHSTVAADPMTYFGFNGRRYYQNMSQQCGSDCVNGVAPRGGSCTGASVGNTGPQQHACTCTGQSTQNSYSTVMSLFGAGTPTPPTVTIVSPKNGTAEQPGFNVTATVSSAYGTANKAELYVDGTLVLALTSQPFAFNAPSTLGPGSHEVKVIGYDNHGQGTATVTAIIGMPCSKPADCPVNTDTCVGGRCVPGPGVQGGLGTSCTMNMQCASGECASDGTNMYCVETCTPGQCPSGFGCLETGSGSSMAGYCWPGYNDGKSGGCSSSSGPIGLGLAFAALLFVRRRRA
jgi:uncharacterized protein (TIGR03382 family)